MHLLQGTTREADSDTFSSVRTKLRIGFLSTKDPGDPDALSGMPYQMRATLHARGATIVRLGASLGASDRRWMNQLVPYGLRQSLPQSLRRSLRAAAGETRRCLERAFAGRTYRMVLARARVASRSIEQEVARLDLDVVFGCCISTFLYDLHVAVPIVYYSDATARLINETYPRYIRRSPGYKTACDELERGALGRVAAGVFASNWARTSAVRDYGLADECAFVIPMGANVVPDIKGDDHLAIEPPRCDSLELCMVAADPERKRLDLAIDTICRLQAGGLDARLTFIGPPTPRALRCRFVRCAGQLRLSNPQDRQLYRRILRESHLMFLPSAGEAFGIAPCEAAHFGRPSVVSDAGGLPEVVVDNVTGVVLPRNACAESYANAIAQFVGVPDRYCRMCQAARRRAVERLSWDRWADEMVRILETVAADLHRPIHRAIADAFGSTHQTR